MPPDVAAPVLVDAYGRPVIRPVGPDPACPQCRGTRRIASSGFGLPHPVCSQCGYEWLGEPFIAEER
jgi:uncharacterized protein (DUF983 family)